MIGPPKSAAGRRRVTLPAVVVEAVAEHLARYTAKLPEAFVFLRSQGKHLRHTAGTLATAAGGSLREVMDRLGHSTTAAVVRHQHVMAERDAAIAREPNRLIEGG